MVRTHGALNLVAVLLAAALVRVPVPPMSAVRDEWRYRGAVVGLALGVPAWWWVGMNPVSLLSGAVMATAALFGPAVAGWLMGGPPIHRGENRALRVLGLVAVTVIVACLFVAVIEGLHARSLSDAPSVVVGFFLLGLVLLGWFGALAAVPFAMIWVWVTDRWTVTVSG